VTRKEKIASIKPEYRWIWAYRDGRTWRMCPRLTAMTRASMGIQLQRPLNVEVIPVRVLLTPVTGKEKP
jgi:hypothetical protein